jgi:hypothetical protein
MRKVCLLCTLLLATGMVLAQTTATKSQSAQGPMVPTTAYRTGAQGFIGDGDALGVPAFAGDDNARGGETFCPTGYLAGQGPGACGSTQWYFYDDLMFCVTPPTTCKRVRCENFPDPTHTITKAIGVVMWTGLYVDDNQDGCTKPEHLFRVRFYTGAAPDPNNPYYSEEHDALATDTGRTVSFSGHAAATVWQFTFVLDNPVNLQTGWFAVTGDGTAGCYHLWEGSAEGNNSFYQWSEQPPGTGYSQNTTLCDLTYCLSEKKIGACCDECAGSQDPVGACTDNVSDVYCAGIGGRWVQNTACSAISPPCGQQTGACCHDDGTCTLELCCDCEPGHVGCEAPKCVGDMNCDGFINFSDINPFVMYMSNIALWQSTYPGCNPKNGDINCDGNYGQASFSDINPFVHIMTLCGSGCTCPGPGCQSTPRNQGDYWAGPATTCDPYPVGGCCTVVIDPNTPGGLHLENEPNNCAPDVYNGGCNITPALFTPIQNGWTIYGQSGTFTAGNPPNSYRDMDWYQVTVNNATSFTVTVEAEFDAIVWADRAGPDPNNPCDGYHDVADVIAPPAGTHNLCTPLVLTTRCLPAGTYWFIVAPANFSGVACGADYKITLQVGAPCEVQNHCADCPGGATYVEGAADGVPGYCQVDPNDPTYDPYNGGCSNTPTGPFELLPHDPNTNPDTFTFCGKVWATGGARDLDWWDLELPVNSQISYTVTTEVPVQAIMLSGDGNFGPSTCDALWGYWGSTWFSPCLPTPFNDTTYYQAGPHYFLVMPTADANQTPIWYG